MTENKSEFRENELISLSTKDKSDTVLKTPGENDAKEINKNEEKKHHCEKCNGLCASKNKDQKVY